MGGYGYFKPNPSLPQMHVFWLFCGNKLFIIGKTPGAIIMADFTKDILIFFSQIFCRFNEPLWVTTKMMSRVQHFQYWIFSRTVMLQHAFITVSCSRTFQSVLEHFNIICRPRTVYKALLKSTHRFCGTINHMLKKQLSQCDAHCCFRISPLLLMWWWMLWGTGFPCFHWWSAFVVTRESHCFADEIRRGLQCPQGGLWCTWWITAVDFERRPNGNSETVS